MSVKIEFQLLNDGVVKCRSNFFLQWFYSTTFQLLSDGVVKCRI